MDIKWNLLSFAVGAALCCGVADKALADSHHSHGSHSHSAHSTSPAEVTESTIDGERYSVTRAVVHASPHHVWQILTDYDNMTRTFPMMKKCQVVKEDGNVKIVKHTVAPSGPVGTYSYTLKITEKGPHLMEWERVSGAFKQVRGFWKLEGLDNNRTTRVTYGSYVDGGLFLPSPLIRRQSRIDMPIVMSSLKNTVESKVQIAGKP